MKFALLLVALFGGNAAAFAMPPEAKALGCISCHDIDAPVVGPAWRDVSRRYRDAANYTYDGKSYAPEDGLAIKISKGGRGNWGTLPMPPQDPGGNHSSDIRALVKFILGLEKDARPPN